MAPSKQPPLPDKTRPWKAGIVGAALIFGVVLVTLLTFRCIHNGYAVLAKAKTLHVITMLSTETEGFFEGTFHPTEPSDSVTGVKLKGCLYGYRTIEKVYRARRSGRRWEVSSKEILYNYPLYLDDYTIDPAILQDIENKYAVPFSIGGTTSPYLHDDSYIYMNGTMEMTMGNVRWSYSCVTAPNDAITILGRTINAGGTNRRIVPLINDAIQHNYVHTIQPGRITPEQFIKIGDRENEHALYFSPIIWFACYWLAIGLFYATLNIQSVFLPPGLALGLTALSWISFLEMPKLLFLAAIFNLIVGYAVLFGYAAYLKKQQPRTLIF